MNRYVADPHWHGYIVWYFYLGGIAAGAYALASLADLFGDEDDRRASRFAHYIAFPLVNVCGVLLIVDLGRPERFWHMLIQSETVPADVQVVVAHVRRLVGPLRLRRLQLRLVPRRAGRGRLAPLDAPGRRGPPRSRRGRGRAGFQRWPGRCRRSSSARTRGCSSRRPTSRSGRTRPGWPPSSWPRRPRPGLAALILLARWRGRDVPEDAIERLEWADGWAVAMELILLVAFALSLGRLAGPAFSRWPGVLIPSFVVPVGLVLPMFLKRLPKVGEGGHRPCSSWREASRSGRRWSGCSGH